MAPRAEMQKCAGNNARDKGGHGDGLLIVSECRGGWLVQVEARAMTKC